MVAIGLLSALRLHLPPSLAAEAPALTLWWPSSDISLCPSLSATSKLAITRSWQSFMLRTCCERLLLPAAEDDSESATGCSVPSGVRLGLGTGLYKCCCCWLNPWITDDEWRGRVGDRVAVEVAAGDDDDDERDTGCPIISPLFMLLLRLTGSEGLWLLGAEVNDVDKRLLSAVAGFEQLLFSSCCRPSMKQLLTSRSNADLRSRELGTLLEVGTAAGAEAMMAASGGDCCCCGDDSLEEDNDEDVEAELFKPSFSLLLKKALIFLMEGLRSSSEGLLPPPPADDSAEGSSLPLRRDLLLPLSSPCFFLLPPLGVTGAVEGALAAATGCGGKGEDGIAPFFKSPQLSLSLGRLWRP